MQRHRQPEGYSDIKVFGEPRLSKEGLWFLNSGAFLMKFKGLRAWGSISRGYMPLDDPVGEDPHRLPPIR